MTPTQIDDLIDILWTQAEVVEPLPGAEPDLRDLDDQPVPGTLLAAIETRNGDYLITGDNDLLALRERYPIVTPAKFRAAHAGL